MTDGERRGGLGQRSSGNTCIGVVYVCVGFPAHYHKLEVGACLGTYVITFNVYL